LQKRTFIDLSANDNAAGTRMELAKHVNEIVLSPGHGDDIKYIGKWDLLGDGDNMDGAEGQNGSVPPVPETFLSFEGVIRKPA
jgi:hypothetical protein